MMTDFILNNLQKSLITVLGFILVPILWHFRLSINRLIWQIRPFPLTVNVASDYATIWRGKPGIHLGQEFYVPKADLNREPPGTMFGWPAWIENQGGCPEGESLLLVTLEYDGDHTVMVRPPSAEIFRQDCPPGSTKLKYQPQGSPTKPPLVNICLNLDTEEIIVIGDDENLSNWIMQKGDILQFLIRATAHQPGIYDWFLRLPVIIAGKEKNKTIKNHRKPFRTAKLASKQPAYFWADSRWIPY